MAHETLSQRPDFGKTFTTAMCLLGLIAAVQITAVGWAIATRPGALPAGASPNPPLPTGPPAPESSLPGKGPPDQLVIIPPASTPPSPGPAVPASGSPLPLVSTAGSATSPGATTFTLPPMPELIDPDLAPPPSPSGRGAGIATGPANQGRLPAPPLGGPNNAGQATLSTILAEAALEAPTHLAISNAEIASLVDSGTDKRRNGDMQGALNDLRQAELVLPEHPRILAEIAATYSEMGLDRRSSLYWDNIRELGDKAAGAWHAIAVGELTGNRVGSAAAAPPVPRILQLGRVNASPDLTVSQGERVVLSVVIDADPMTRPNPAEMSMAVYFYDLVDGEKSEASTADTSQHFISQPYDWQSGGKESIEVIYHQPEFTEEQKRELGERQYYGYIIELYYRDQLQDSAAFPPDLRSLNPNVPPSPLGSPPIGPDNSLFPDIPVDDDA